MNQGDLLSGGLIIGPLGLGLTLVLLAVVAWMFARSRQEQTRMPDGKVIYTDTGTWLKQQDALFSPNLQLVGRPDYLVAAADGQLIPVEVKSRTSPHKPHESHILQLAAYCLLVEETYGVRPTYGILQYRDNAFAIDYTDDLEEDLLDLLTEMREDMFEEEIDRDHDDWNRCARCGVKDFCYQRLT
ncbi:MAG: PD-(D/E)XK nuclease family protein [Candidatus Promineifilaceae bacterium]